MTKRFQVYVSLHGGAWDLQGTDLDQGEAYWLASDLEMVPGVRAIVRTVGFDDQMRTSRPAGASVPRSQDIG